MKGITHYLNYEQCVSHLLVQYYIYFLVYILMMYFPIIYFHDININYW